MKDTYSILLIDDDSEDRKIFIEAIKDIDDTIQYHIACDGLEALDLLTTKKISRPDVIFLDLNMPRLDGKQFLIERNKIKKLLSIPVVVYTTTKRSEDIEETKKLGVSYFLTKPVKYKKICEAISDVIEKVREKALS